MIAAEYTPESMALRATYLEEKGLKRRAANLWQQIITHPLASDELREEACKRCGVEVVPRKPKPAPAKPLPAAVMPSLARLPPAARKESTRRVVTARTAEGVKDIEPVAPVMPALVTEDNLAPAANDAKWTELTKPKPARQKPKPLTEKQKARQKELRKEREAKRKAEAIAKKEAEKKAIWLKADAQKRIKMKRAAEVLANLERLKEEERAKKRKRPKETSSNASSLNG